MTPSAAPGAPPPANRLLTVRGVETFYGKIQALKGVDIDVNEGEIVTLIGANGAGKSTTMMTIFGSPRARRGLHHLRRARHHAPVDRIEIARLSIAQSPEGRRIFPRMTVFENLQMGASIDGFAHFDEDLERMFAMFPRLKERAQQRGGTLSGGEQQMLAIARALMSRPRLLAARRAVARPRAADRQADLQRHRRSQQDAGPDCFSGRAERLPRAQARPSRLCHGQRPDHDERHRARNCWRGPKCAPPISKEAIDGRLLWADTDNGWFVFLSVLTVLGAAAGRGERARARHDMGSASG